VGSGVVGGLLTMALAMAAAVGAATAVPIEAAVGGVSVVTVAVAKIQAKDWSAQKQLLIQSQWR